MGGEDEVPIDVAGRTYIIEFAAMQQVCSTLHVYVQCNTAQ